MKRTTALVLVVSATLLLGGCWPYYRHHDGHGGDHGRYYGGDRGGQEYHRY
jgi:uncharacterized protein YceK